VCVYVAESLKSLCPSLSGYKIRLGDLGKVSVLAYLYIKLG
jgi:hypothetical protein